MAFDGGLARLPENARLDFIGMPTEGLAFGCLAETLLLGFDGHNHSFCKGRISVAQVHTHVGDGGTLTGSGSAPSSWADDP